MKRILFAVRLVYLISATAQAQSFIGPGSRATGGTGRAAVSAVDGAYMNPASISYLNRYYIGGTYFTDSGDTTDRARGWSVHVTDANPEALVAASLGYVKSNYDIPGFGGIDSQDVLLALSGIVYRGISFGLSGHHAIHTAHGENSSYTNMNVGFLFAPSTNFGIGVVSYDVLHPEYDMPNALRPKNTYGVGVSYLYQKLVRFKADILRQEPENPDRKMAFGAGFETFLIPELAVRAGYHYDDLRERKIYSAGFGFEGPKFSVDYAAQIVDGENGSRHSIDLWLAF